MELVKIALEFITSNSQNILAVQNASKAHYKLKYKKVRICYSTTISSILIFKNDN